MFSKLKIHKTTDLNKGRKRNGKVLKERNERGIVEEKKRKKERERDGKDINSIQHVQLWKFK